MRYCWDDFTLDREGTLLTRQGQQVGVTRKILDCVTYLIEQRHRVVSYDELIRAVWGHTEISNNQLAQLVLSARRTLDDDGHTQRLIRNLPGLGYRWVSPLREALAVEPGERSEGSTGPDGARASATGVYGFQPIPVVQGHDDYRLSSQQRSSALIITVPETAGWWTAWTSCQMWRAHARVPGETQPLRILEAALWRGDFAKVRDGLAALPQALAEAADAQMLSIRLDIERDCFDRAAVRIADQLREAAAAGDRVRQAQLLTLRSERAARMASAASEQLAPAVEAVSLLEGNCDQSRHPLAAALTARGRALLAEDQIEAAMDDLVRAQDMLLQSGDERCAAIAGGHLAHVWLRMGRIGQAYDRLNEAAEALRRCGDACNAIHVRNLMTRILLEQLRWDEALASSEGSLQIASRLPEPRRHDESLRLRALTLTCAGRLQEAGCLLDECEISTGPTGVSLTCRAMHAAAAGRMRQALRYAECAVHKFESNGNADLWLESRDGAVLMWMLAARHIHEQCGVLPTLSPAHDAILEAPCSLLACISRGHWSASHGLSTAAGELVFTAFEDARKSNRCWSMLLASKPSLEMLVRRGDILQSKSRTAASRPTVMGVSQRVLMRSFAENQLKNSDLMLSPC